MEKYLAEHPEAFLHTGVEENQVLTERMRNDDEASASLEPEAIDSIGHAKMDGHSSPSNAGDFGLGDIIADDDSIIVGKNTSLKNSIKGSKGFGTGGITPESPSSYKVKRWKKHNNKWTHWSFSQSCLDRILWNPTLGNFGLLTLQTP